MGVRNRNGVLFFESVSIGYIAMQFMILVFPYERPIFLKEVNGNMYSVGPYFFGRFFAEIPAGLIVPIIYGTLIYFLVGLDTTEHYKYFLHGKHPFSFIFKTSLFFSWNSDRNLQCNFKLSTCALSGF